jgi:uncharacterized RDD family membrane protein YckC
MKPLRTFDAHETERLHSIHGTPLASFTARAGAFSVDFLLAFFIFLGLLMLAARVAAYVGIQIGDLNLKFDFEHWYSILFIVAYFSLSTFLGNGRTPGKWIFGIRVVSLVHDRMSLWHSFERALGYGASALEFGFGFLQYFIHPNRRTVHDRIAETIVIHDRKK